MVTQEMEKLRGQTQDGEVTEKSATARSNCYPPAEGTTGEGGLIDLGRVLLINYSINYSFILSECFIRAIFTN